MDNIIRKVVETDYNRVIDFSSRKGRTLLPCEIDRIRELFPTTKTELIASELGVSTSTVRYHAYKMGVVKDKDFLHTLAVERSRYSVRRRNTRTHVKSWFKQGESIVDRIGAERNELRKKKISETMKANYRKERLRVSYGMDQRTKLKLAQPRAKINLRYSLKHRDYILDEEKGIAYYNDDTQRSSRLEAKRQPWYIFKEQPKQIYDEINTTEI